MFKRKHFFSFAILLLAFLVRQQVAAQCTTQAGTIQPGAYSVCSNESFTVPYNNDAVLDSNDMIIFVLHSGGTSGLGNIINWSYTPEFLNLSNSANTFQTLQIATIAGNSLNGWPDFNDPCLSVNGGATLTINPAPQTGIISPLILNCNGNTAVTLNASAWPQGISYQFQWSGPVSDPTAQNPSTSTPGVYTVTVTNSICSTTASTTVYTPATVPVSIVHTNFNCTGAGSQQLFAQSNLQGNTYAWSTGATTPSITVPEGSEETYCVSITFQQGCTNSVCDTAIDFVPAAEIVYSNYFECQDSADYLSVNTNLFSPGAVSTYSWEHNGVFSDAYVLFEPEPGYYSVTITSAGGCVGIASYFLESTSAECADLEGFVWGDMNSSCDYDSGDIPLSDVIVSVKNAAGNIIAYGYTDETGYWKVGIAPGDYTISAIPKSAVWAPCPVAVIVSAPGGSTITQDFYMQPAELCSDLWVDLGNSFFRRCLPASYNVNYCNDGTITAEDAYIDITLDPFLIIDSSSAAYTPVLGTVNIYRFDLGDIPVGACGNFWIAVHVSCNATIGEALCSSGTIFPHAPCGPQNLWSGASVAITGICNPDSIQFILKNVGTATMTNPLEYVVIEDAIIMKTAPPPTVILGAGEELVINVPANGATWRTEAVQEINHPGNSMPSLTIEGCTVGQIFSVGYVNQFPLDDNDPWLDEDCAVVVGSYDPNAKEGFPIGYGVQQQIERNTDLEYVIHFQNIGTDTAFTVVIRDTIASWLDATTIRPGAGSHSYKFDFYGEGSHLKFTFDHINLPDSTTNLQGSQGFVTYRISQKPGVPFGTDILNNAAIYFDFNEPVITNTTRHLVDTNFLITVSIWTPVAENITLNVMPNPAQDVATLFVGGLSEGTTARVEILDQSGRVCQTGYTTNGNWTVRRNQLAAGVYAVRITTDKGVLGTGKVVFK